ncbi:MAG: hypothetical protein LBQ76_02045 [Candidatus Fibromonas sp.]|jgi:uncharacterized protein (TIGR02145 family)|nr:hypothetical protein [Candidatus Fibromonas sp.]
MKKVIALLALFSVAVFAQNTFTDPRDGKKYKSVKIGEQTWMAQNLDYHGEDGFLGLCYDDQPSKKIKKPENCQKYGRLYDWDEAIKACPEGWHLPANNDWTKLMDFLASNKKDVHYGKESVPGLAGIYENAGKYLKTKNGWNDHDFSQKSPNAPKCKWTELDNRGRSVEHNECATDEYGFSALSSGVGLPDGRFGDIGINGNWWSASKGINNNTAFWWNISYNRESIMWTLFPKSSLISVRCVQDYDPAAAAREAERNIPNAGGVKGAEYIKGAKPSGGITNPFGVDDVERNTMPPLPVLKDLQKH